MFRAPQGGGRGIRYGRYHHAECLCEACEQEYALHQQTSGYGRCGCADCQTTEHLIHQREQATIMSSSTIHMCERCPALGKTRAMARVQIALSLATPEAKTLEICPACAAELHTWMTGTDIGHRERAYSEPYDPALAVPAPPEAGLASASTEDLVRAIEARPPAEVHRARYIATGDRAALKGMLDAMEDGS